MIVCAAKSTAGQVPGRFSLVQPNECVPPHVRARFFGEHAGEVSDTRRVSSAAVDSYGPSVCASDRINSTPLMTGCAVLGMS